MPSRPESQRDPNVPERPETEQDQPSDELDAVRRFIEDLALVFTRAGMPRMPARVFGALLATQEESLTAGELAATLQVSPAAISGAVRYLEPVNMIHRGREPGARRDHYYVVEDVWYEAFAHNDVFYKYIADSCDAGIAAVGAESRAGMRIRETRDFFTFMSAQVPRLIEQWRAQRAAQEDEAEGCA